MNILIEKDYILMQKVFICIVEFFSTSKITVTMKDMVYTLFVRTIFSSNAENCNEISLLPSIGFWLQILLALSVNTGFWDEVKYSLMIFS